MIFPWNWNVQPWLCNGSQLDEVCQLLRSTGYLRSQPAKRPANYPDDLFRRVAVNAAFANAVVDHLRTDDIYHQLGAQPHPDHRSTALAQQVRVHNSEISPSLL